MLDHNTAVTAAEDAVSSVIVPLTRSMGSDDLADRRQWIHARLRARRRTSPLRVLIASNSLGRGGAEHQILRLMPHLGRLGLVTEHLYYAPPHSLRTEFAAAGLCTQFVDKQRLGQGAFWGRMLTTLRRGHFDVVHAFTGTANFYVRAAALLAGVPAVLGGWRNRVMAPDWQTRLALSVLNPWCGGWVVNSPTNAEALERLWWVRPAMTHVVPNALDAARPRLAPTDWAGGELSRWIGGRLVVGTVGAISPQKDPDLFLDLAQELAPLADRVCFCAVGGASPRNRDLLLRLQWRVAGLGLSGHARLLGPTDDVDGFLRLLSIFVLTSGWEGCPNVVMEAMRAGLPIVMTNCTDTSKLVEWDQNGYVVSCGRPGPLSAQVRRLVDDPGRRRRFGRRSREMCRRNFGAARSAWKLAQVYVHEWEAGSPRKATAPAGTESLAGGRRRTTSSAREGIAVGAARPPIQLSRLESEPWAWHVVRKVSIRVTPVLARLGCSPNQVTVLAMALGLAGGGLWAMGSDPGFVVGAVLLQLMYLFDCCDGELARHLKRTGPRGAFLDLTGHYFVNTAMVVGASVGLARSVGTWIGWVGLCALVASVGDEFQRGVLLRVAQKAGIELAKAHEGGSFRSTKAGSRAREFAAFVCGSPGLFTSMLGAAVADLALPGHPTKVLVLLGWTAIVTLKLAARLRRSFTFLADTEAVTR